MKGIRNLYLIGVLFLTFILIIGSISFAVAESGRDRNNDNNDDREDNSGIDDSEDDDPVDLAEDDDPEDDDAAEFKTKEKLKVEGDDGVEREIEIEYRERDGKIEQKIKYKSKDGESEIEIEFEDEIEVVDEAGDDTNKTKREIKVKLHDGTNASVKIMPDVASARALEALRLRVCSTENNCTIVLKDVGQRDDSSDDVSDVAGEERLRYELKVEKKYKLFGLFERDAEVKAEIRADNGDLTDVERPWWTAFSSEVEDDSAGTSAQ